MSNIYWSQNKKFSRRVAGYNFCKIIFNLLLVYSLYIHANVKMQKQCMRMTPTNFSTEKGEQQALALALKVFLFFFLKQFWAKMVRC